MQEATHFVWWNYHTCSHNMADGDITFISSKEGCGEHDGVEWDVIFGHELIQFDLNIFGRLPPL